MLGDTCGYCIGSSSHGALSIGSGDVLVLSVILLEVMLPFIKIEQI